MQRVEAGGRNEHLLLYSAPQWGSFSLRHVCSAGVREEGCSCVASNRLNSAGHDQGLKIFASHVSVCLSSV